ncbi:MAG TPA: erythromycin esterase family protein [Saprospiraceae bacterium]|nr:erythromycin esterase family protein [Saprospiraceae bacterium]
MRRYFTKAPSLQGDQMIRDVQQYSHRLHSKADLKPLFDRIGDARIVMLGEATHGTHEYYMWRAYISRKLIEEKGFSFIAVEGDWPDCYRLNRYVKGYEDRSLKATEVLQTFDRWPSWMWGNWEIAAWADWLVKFNSNLPANKKVGFYGLDVYSLWESMESIMSYLQKTDPKALVVAEQAFRCFEPYRQDEGRAYAYALRLVPDHCKNEVVQLLSEIRMRLPQYNTDHENVFSAEQNALIAVHAENYYRAMIQGGPHSWNVRDRHMLTTLQRLLDFHGHESKAIVWAHNTHIGDARATDMVNEGMFNIGELARVQFSSENIVLVGFGSYVGTVTAGRNWGGKTQTMEVPRALEGSWESVLHAAGDENQLLLMEDFTGNDMMMENHIGHRAIGVVYDPRREEYGNYVPTIVPLRYDAFIFLDETEALHPLSINVDKQQIPETYPFGF